jgi:hypothetical protein
VTLLEVTLLGSILALQVPFVFMRNETLRIPVQHLDGKHGAGMGMVDTLAMMVAVRASDPLTPNGDFLLYV